MSSEAVIDLVARGGRRAYRLRLWLPPGPVPAAGHPLLWVLDGDGYHGLAVDAVRNRGVIGGEIEAAVVVALGYPENDVATWMARRFYDFTPTVPPPGRGRAGLAHGGLDALLDLIEEQALPAVQARCAVDASRMAIFGHSMGALAVLHAMFTRPGLFESALAVSPAIHWNDSELLAHEVAFRRRLLTGPNVPRLYIGVGGLEQEPLEALPPGSTACLEALNATIASERYVDHAVALAARLQGAAAAGQLALSHGVLAGETHMSAPFAAMRPALDLAFGRRARP